ncbi:MAG: TolB family protein, partial [Planctomycetota bacterium]
MGLAFANCKPRGGCDRHATRSKNAGVLCAVLLGCLLPTAVIGGVSSEGNTDGVLTWHLGRIEPGQSTVRTVLFAYADSLEELTSVVEAAKRKAEGLGGEARVDGRIEAEIAWLRNDTTSFGLEPTGSFSAVGHGPALSRQLHQFNWYIRYNDGTEKTAGVPIWSGARRREGRKRDELENMRVVSALSGDNNQAAATLETTDRKLNVTVRAMVLKGPAAAVEFTLANTAQDAIDQVELSILVNIDAGPRSTRLDCSVVDSSLGGILTINPLNNRHVAFVGQEPLTRGYCGQWPSQERLRYGKGIPFETWQPFAGLSNETRRRLIRGHYMPATLLEPNEPPTKTLSTVEAKRLIEADWLGQAGDNLSAERIADEIRWARELAQRLRRDPRTRELSAELAELERLSKQLESSPREDDRTRQLYLGVRRVKRIIMLSNPAIDFDSILFIDNPYPLGSEWPHEVSHRNGRFAVAGGRLLILRGLHPGGKVEKLAPEKPGSFWRPDISFDAKTVLFCYKAHDEQSFDLYEVNIDGTGLRRLTSGPYDDLDPIYLPDGHIIFSTTRSNTYLRCGPYMYTYVLARCDSDGGNIYLISRGNESEWLPTLLEDGRVIYSRWEYTDKALWRVQSLWTVNPDGTNTSAFWGNQSIWPDHVAEARPIPGDGRVMFTG